MITGASAPFVELPEEILNKIEKVDSLCPVTNNDLFYFHSKLMDWIVCVRWYNFMVRNGEHQFE